MLLLVLVLALAFTSCKKGLIFDKDMVIGTWKMWEIYSPGYTYYWTFTDDMVYIYKQADSTTAFNSDKAPNDASMVLVYQQSGWNTGGYDINLFDHTNPFMPNENLNCRIDISKFNRNYLVLTDNNHNWSASLGRVQ